MLCKQGSTWRSQAVGVALGVLALCGSVQAGTFWYVDDDAPADGDGLTWETGYQFLQDALAVAEAGDEIHVAQGTYHPDEPGDTGDRDATFTMKNGVTMKGGFAGLGAEDPDERDPDLYPAILSGDLAGDDQPDFVNYEENSYHVVTASGTDATAVLDGFTIAAGFAEARNGAGIFAEAGGPTIRDCTIERNLATASELERTGLGGGMYTSDADPFVNGCTFAQNKVESNSSEAHTGAGGGLACVHGAPTVTECDFRDNLAAGVVYLSGVGAGMFCFDGSEATIRGSEFVGNVCIGSESPYGAGLCLLLNSHGLIANCEFRANETRGPSGGGGTGLGLAFNCDPIIRNCDFVENYANHFTGGLQGWDGCDPVVMDCTFIRNSAEHGAGGACFGAYADQGEDPCYPVLINCAFQENTVAGTFGAGAFYADAASPTLVACTFTDNVAGGQYGGGAIQNGLRYSEGEHLLLVGCLFARNEASSGPGGAISNWWLNETTAINCTFVSNHAAHGGGAMYTTGTGRPGMVNSIVYANTPDQIVDDGEGETKVHFSDVQDGWPGVGNIDLDPMLDENYRPLPGSPVIDAGANNAVPPDTFDLDDDGDIQERLALDLDGNPRFADDPDTTDTGCGEPVQVDMGAFEYQGVPWHPMLVGDVDGDGAVGFSDLLEVLSAWGECDSECCLADIDFSWVVDFDDLLTVLSNWS